MSLVLEPLADTKLVLCGTEETGLLFGVLLALFEALRSCVKLFVIDWVLTSYKQRRTLPCREEEAVSVLTAPILEKALEGAARCANSEPAGRARLMAERANTIVNV